MRPLSREACEVVRIQRLRVMVAFERLGVMVMIVAFGRELRVVLMSVCVLRVGVDHFANYPT